MNFDQVILVLKSDPSVTEVEMQSDDKRGDYAVGFWTNLLTRDDEESWEEYEKRIGGWKEICGLSNSTIRKLWDLGFEVFGNDCEGCENEGIVYPRLYPVDQY